MYVVGATQGKMFEISASIALRNIFGARSWHKVVARRFCKYGMTKIVVCW